MDKNTKVWEKSTTFQYLKNIKTMPECKAMDIWKWQNQARKAK